MRIHINSKAPYGMESWGLHTAGILDIHKNLAVCYFTPKHTVCGIPEATESLQTSKLSTAQFFRRTTAVPMTLLPTHPVSSDALYVCARLTPAAWMMRVLQGTLHITKYHTHQQHLLGKKHAVQVEDPYFKSNFPPRSEHWHS